MRNSVLVCLILSVMLPTQVLAEDFLGAPVPAGGTVTLQTESRLEKAYETPFDDVVNFYAQAFKNEKDVKFWDRKSEMYIEDHGSRPWHSVTVTKMPKGGTDITILKDNWTWILGTLVLRFVAVFAVLMVLYVALAISGAIVSKSVRKTEKK